MHNINTYKVSRNMIKNKAERYVVATRPGHPSVSRQKKTFGAHTYGPERNDEFVCG